VAVVSAAERLREVCALMLAEGEPGPELAAWCRRVLDEPGYAERAVRIVTDITSK
jgi:hypothetical protein